MRSKFFGFLLAGLIVAFSSNNVFAGRLKVENARISEVNTGKKTAKIQCDVSWDNAWKNDTIATGFGSSLNSRLLEAHGSMLR